MEFTRLEILLGEKIEKLKKLKVLGVGVGGVGGYAVEALARSGISNITIVDYDKVDITNINRQIIDLHSTIGKLKAKVALNYSLNNFSGYKMASNYLDIYSNLLNGKI